MKKIITTIFVSAMLISVSGKAQTTQPQTGKHSMQGMQQMLVDSLHLTATQADSVVAIRKEFSTKRKDILNDQAIPADQKKEQLKPLARQMKMRLQTFLTKDQMNKMQEMQHNMHKGKMKNQSSQ